MGLIDDFLLLPDWIKLLFAFGLMYSLAVLPIAPLLFLPFLGALPGGTQLPTFGDAIGLIFKFVFGLIGINADYKVIVIIFGLMLLITFINWMEQSSR